jgi:formate/nitrite transporter FocA (FNT family)
VKWGFYLGGGFLLAMAMHFARRVQQLERPLQVRGFHFAREFLFSLGFLLVVLLVSEPFLAQESQKTEFRFQLRLPTVGGAVPVSRPGVSSNQTFMNQEVLLTMLLFFVLQALLYVACLVKLAEIRRQRIGPRMKLKLLENEDHLFDAGLYLGFFGTIVSLILVSLGVFKQPSLMAAYSSTSFGILFVSFFKICHLRAARRKLLLEADAAQADEAEAPAPVQTYAVS